MSKIIWIAVLVLPLCFSCAEMEQAFNQASADLQGSMQSSEDSGDAKLSPQDSPKQEQNGDALIVDHGSPGSVPVSVRVDGVEAIPNSLETYFEVDKLVSSTPDVVFWIDPSMGDFQSVILNIYTANAAGEPSGRPYAITGNGELMPGEKFSISSPGVTIISPQGERVQSVPYESGKRYIALLAISGSARSYTPRVRFRVK